MKCKYCGYEMPDTAKFCEMCGAPVDAELTQLADEEFRPEYQNDPDSGFPEDPNSFNAYENDYIPDNYIDDGYRPDPRSFEPSGEDRPYDRYAPVYDDPYMDPRGGRPRMSGQKKALIISAIALVLVVAILSGVIFFVSRNRVSAEELEEAKQDFLPPAEAIAIDTSLDDPSDDDITFQYDGRGRIDSCSYSVNDKAYDQSYGYNDDTKLIQIDTKYRGRTIFTKEIEYTRVSEANTFEAVDGYYVRLDDKSLDDDSTSTSSASVETASPEPVDPDPLPPEPTAKPAEAEEPLERYQELYIDFLDTTTISYSKGTLIYLNNDDTPELILWSSGSEVPYYVCYILNDTVLSYETASSHSLEYTERGGYFTSGKYNQTGNIYYFDGSSVSAEHTFSYSIGNDAYYIDQERLTREEYFDAIDNVYLIKDRKYDASNDPHEKSSLQAYIRSF